MSGENPWSARRRVPRRAFDAPVGLLLLGHYDMVRSYQVGEGGMMVSAGRPMNLDRQVVLNFFLPSGVCIIVRGVVRSVIPAKGAVPMRYGVEFLNLGFQAKREIRNFVAAATRLDGQILDQKNF